MTQDIDTPMSAVPQDPPRPGRVDTHKVPYVVAGVVLLVQSVVTVGWQLDMWLRADVGMTTLLDALFDPTGDPVSFAMLASHKWALAVAMLVTALCLFARRRAARSAAILLGSLMLLQSIRGTPAVLDPRSDLPVPDDLRTWSITSWTFTAIAAVALLVLMLIARDTTSAPRVGRASLYRGGGVLLIVFALLGVSWLFMPQVADEIPMYLRMIVDARLFGPYGLFGSSHFYGAFAVVAAVALGVLAILRKRSVRGAVLVLMSIELYLSLFNLRVAMDGVTWSENGVVREVPILLVMPLLAVSILVLFAVDSDKRAATASHAPGGPALTSDLGEQDSGGD